MVVPLSLHFLRSFQLKRNNFITLSFFLSFTFFACSPDELQQEYSLINVDLPGHIHSLGFINDSIGYVTGGDTWHSGFIGTTINGGATFTYDSLSPKMMMCLDVESNNAIAAGFEGLVYRNSEIENWRKQNIDRKDFIRDIEMIDDSTFLAVGGLAYRFGRIVKFTDATSGRSVWTEIEDNPELSAIDQVDDNTFIAVGYGTILRSIDSGESWTVVNQDGDFFKDVLFIDEEVGFVIGYDGLILKSMDSGLTWSSLRTSGDADSADRLRALTSTSTGQIWIGGKSGLLLMSDNGGDSWVARKLNTESDINMVHYHRGFIYAGGQDGFFVRIPL